MTRQSNDRPPRRARALVLPILAGAGLGLALIQAVGHLAAAGRAPDAASIDESAPLSQSADDTAAASSADLRILAEEPAGAPGADSGDVASREPEQAAGGPVMDDGVLVLAWEDLMPPGEQEKADQEYLDYFSRLEREARASAGMSVGLLSSNRTLAEGAVGGIAEGGALDQMVQFGTFNTIPELDGRLVRIPGYIVPFDFSADDKYTEFLFAPYFGACIHSPPPPPNQIVYVTLDAPVTIRDTYPAFWIEGVLTAERNENDLGDAAYTLRLSKLAPYEGPHF